ncbi:DDE-type integrase/transposase/recombinase [Amycolatopsis sp. FDAARGOS 1241]|nr:DDE-type integrase/transposase/recombinase [Amycolatopsis sp. FDAARGOS 1241]
MTATGVLRRVVALFAAPGVTVDALSDNGLVCRSHAWRDACTELGMNPKPARLYRPRTNGTIGRRHRAMATGRAYARPVPHTPSCPVTTPGPPPMRPSTKECSAASVPSAGQRVSSSRRCGRTPGAARPGGSGRRRLPRR